jgi:MFS family permease
VANSAVAVKKDLYTSHTFRAFTNQSYIRLWLANFLLYTARWMQMTLLIWLVLELTDSPWLVALVGFFSSAPMFVLGLVGGVLADGGNRQRLLTSTQLGNVGVSVLLMIFLSSGAVEVWQAYLTSLVSGVCWALDTPTRRAVIFDLLGLEGVTNAMALDSVGMNASRMCGPALAGVLITLVGVSGGYTVVTVFYALQLVLLWSLRLPTATRQMRRQQSIGRNLLEGLRYVVTNRLLLATIYITVAMNMLLFPYVQMVPIIARDVLRVDPILMGMLQAAEGCGALVGAILIAASVNIRYHGRIFYGGSLLALLTLFGFSMSPWYIVSFPILLVLGFGTAGFGAMQSTLAVLAAQPDMRGRALGVVSLAIGTGPLGSLLMGAMASAVHPVFAIRMNALLGIIALAVIALVLPMIMDRTQPVRAATP